MPLISRSIPTLLRGVSQSSDATKKPDHCDIQDNATSDPVLGLVKRSGTQFVSNLISGEQTIGNAKVHMINRDATERYVVVFTSNNVRVFELDGTEKTVTKPDGVTYLSCSDPKSEIKTITIADFTFVVNTTITTAMSSTLTSGTDKQAVVFFNQVSDLTTYRVTVDGTQASHYSGGDNPLSTTTIANKIKDKLLGANGESPDSGSPLSGFTITNNGPVLRIKKNNNTDFSIGASDSQGNSQITLVKNSVQQFTDLPTVSPNGMVVEIIGDESNNFDNYYVQFTTNNGGAFEEGQWQEAPAPGIQFKFNYSTMPHVLIRQADGNFRFAKVDGGSYALTFPNSATYSQSAKVVTVTANGHGLSVGSVVDIKYTTGNAISGDFTITNVTTNTFTYTAATSLTTSGNASFGIPNYGLPVWGERICGDLESSLNPSFIGNKINNVFFFRNRLGFLASDNVILSTVSKFFNFFPETVLSVIDSDPIDVAASHTKVAILKNAVNMGEKLILFSDQTQFVLSSSADNLTPKTANILVATEFESSDGATPVGAGSSIYYLTNKGNFSGVREYITQTGIEVKDAANITIHVPKLIPSDIFKIAVNTNEDILVLLGTSNSNKLYVNKWLYGAKNEKILNSWFTYTFSTSRIIRNIEFIGTDLFLVTEDIVDSGVNTEINLEKLIFEPDFKEPHTDFEYRLDRKVTESDTGVSISYDSSANQTTITCPYRLDEQMTVVGREVAPRTVAKYNSTTSNNTITVTYPNHGFITGDLIEVSLPGPNINNYAILETDISAIITFAIGGFLDDNDNPADGGLGISDFFYITVVDANTFTFTTDSNSDGGNNTNTMCVIRLEPFFIDKFGTIQRSEAGHIFNPLVHTLGTNTNIVIPGDLRHARFIIGENYEMHYRFAKQRLTENSGNELISGRLQLKHFYLKFEDTGFMTVEVIPEDESYDIIRSGGIGSDPLQHVSTYQFTSLLGVTKESKRTILKTGTFKVPVMARSNKVTIDVKNNTFLPTNLSSAEYEAFFYIRSNRR